MKKFICFFFSIFCSASFASTLNSPSEMKWGAKFTHFTCEKFSTTAKNGPSLFNDLNIKLEEFGVGPGMHYAVFNAFFGEENECEYRLQLKRNKQNQTLEFVTSQVSDEQLCAEGKRELDHFFSKGVGYAEKGQGHRYLSFQVYQNIKNSCADPSQLHLEYQRIR